MKVIATTRSADRFPLLEKLGVTRCELEGPELSKRLPEAGQLTKILDLVGNSVIVDSLSMLRRYGRACIAGWVAWPRFRTSIRSLRKVAAGRFKAKPARVFKVEEIREAHRVMEANEAGGKMVVVVD